MAISWGPVSNNFRLGIEVVQSPSSVGSGTGHVVLTVKVFGQSVEWGHNWTYTLSFSGAWYGSKQVSFYSGTGQTVTKLFHQTSVTVPTSFADRVSRTFNASVNGYGASNISYTYWVASRPYEKPRPPVKPAAVWVSDGRARLTWETNADPQNAGKPWSGVRVQRYTGSDKTWRTIAELPWNATSFEDTTAPLNEHVQYALVAWNSSGESDPAMAGTVNQRPAAPVNIEAEKTGSNIRVTWSYENQTPNYPAGFTIYDNGIRAGSVSGNARAWTHSSPSTTQTHRYTVTATVDSPSLESAHSAYSNIVQLLTRPSAPSILAPSGNQPRGTLKVRWRHNPLDSSVQTRAELRYKLPGDTWRTRPITGTTQESLLNTSSYGHGVGEVQIQVRTWGAYLSGQEAGASPWSAVSTFAVVDNPTVTLSNIPSLVKTSRITPSWAYYQQQGSPQSAAQIQLYEGSELVDENTLHGATATYQLAIALKNETTYTLKLRVRSGHGLWSNWAVSEFTTNFPLPSAPNVELIWNNEIGGLAVHISNPPPSSGTPPVETNQVLRSVDGGRTWETVHENLGPNTVIIDYEALSWGETQYKIIAISSLPTAAETLKTVTVKSHNIWIGADQGFTTQIRLPYNPKISFQTGLISRKIYQFAGRTHGVETTGTARQRTASISSLIIEDDPTSQSSTSGEAEELGYKPAPFIYRDPTGRRIYCSISDVNISRSHLPRWTFSAKLEEISRE